MITFSEAIKLKDGILYNLDYHQDRVNKTASDFYKARIDLSVIPDAIPLHATSGLFKCRIVYTDKIESVEFIPYTFRCIRKVGVVSDDTIDYRYKYADRTPINRLLEASGCDDILIIKNGLVTDASSSSLVFQTSQALYTPRENLLPGTKRRFLLNRGLITERSIPVSDIPAFDSVHFINAMVDLEDHIQIDTASLIFL